MNSIVPLALAVIVLMALRLRRMMTDQSYNAVTIWTRLGLLGVLAIVVLLVEMASHVALLGSAAGFVLGLLGGAYSLNHTVFHFDSDPQSYRTNPYIGSAVITLFAIRVLYDALEAHRRLGHPGAVNPLAVSWLAGLLYFLFVAYWGAYYFGIIRAFRRQTPL